MISSLQIAPQRDTTALSTSMGRVSAERAASFRDSLETADASEAARRSDAASRKDRAAERRVEPEDDALREKNDADDSEPGAARSPAAAQDEHDVASPQRSPGVNTADAAPYTSVAEGHAHERDGSATGNGAGAQLITGSGASAVASLTTPGAEQPGVRAEHQLRGDAGAEAAAAPRADRGAQTAHAASGDRSPVTAALDEADRGTAPPAAVELNGRSAARAVPSGREAADAVIAARHTADVSAPSRTPTESAVRAVLSGDQTSRAAPTAAVHAAARQRIVFVEGSASSPAAQRAAEVEFALRTEQVSGVSGASVQGDGSSGPRGEAGGRTGSEPHTQRPGDPSVTARGVERSLTTLASLRGGRMELTLDPADLGRVQVRMAMRGSAVRVEIIAQQAQATARLQSQLQDLRQGLERQGLHVERMTVQTASESSLQSDRAQRDEQERHTSGHGTHEHAREDADGRSRGRRDEFAKETDDAGRDRGAGWVDALKRMINGAEA